MEGDTPPAEKDIAAILYASANPGRPAVTIQAISNWQYPAQQGMVEMRARYTFLLTNTRKDEIITERMEKIPAHHERHSPQ
jgi:3-polyprenyl-4-hydroxybenzoate decarboxylase